MSAGRLTYFRLIKRLEQIENLKFLLPIKVKKWLKIRNATLSCVNAKVGWWKDTPN